MSTNSTCSARFKWGHSIADRWALMANSESSLSEPIVSNVLKLRHRPCEMIYPSFLDMSASNKSSSTTQASGPEVTDAMDDLVHQKSRLQARKLEILASEIGWRLRIAAENVQHLERDSARTETMINQLSTAANYGLREHQEKAPLYRRLSEIESQVRAQRTESWRDVTSVMRDFLVTWEAHQQAQARARFLHDVGSGPEDPL